MTLRQRLESHRGGLIRLKTQLFWEDGRGWDKNPGRICLILDADALHRKRPDAVMADGGDIEDAALLLVDGSPQWIWLAEADVEIL